MSYKVPIGGEGRIGTGNKVEAEIHGYSRSTHNLSTTKRTTMAAGTIIPIMNTIGLKGDTWDIKLAMEIMTHPTIGPLFGSFKAQIEVYEAPLSLYMADLAIDSTEVGMNMDKVFIPQQQVTGHNIDFSKALDTQQINPSCILNYLGIRGIGKSSENSSSYVSRNFSALGLLAYWDIYKHYHANKQEKIGAVIHDNLFNQPGTLEDSRILTGLVEWEIPTGGTTYQTVRMTPSTTIIMNMTGMTEEFRPEIIKFDTMDGLKEGYEMFTDWVWNFVDQTVTGSGCLGAYNEEIAKIYIDGSGTEINQEPRVEFFDLKNLDTMRMNLMKHIGEEEPYLITDLSLPPYGLVHYRLGEVETAKYSKMSPQEGLGVKTYLNDKYQNWLNTEWIDGANGVNQLTAVNVIDNKVTMNDLSMSKKMFDVKNRIAMSGGSYQDFMDAVYTKSKIKKVISPIYHGGLIRELVFQEIISNAQTAEQPLGTLAGRGVLSRKNKGGYVTVKPEEHCVIMALMSLTPRIDYSQGNEWFNNLLTMDDFHKPGLDAIGFQDVITDGMAAWDTTIDHDTNNIIYRSAGKQPAWTEYMTDVNKTYGNFAIRNDQMFMTLNRDYEPDYETGQIKDLTTYIDPKKYNHIFANTRRDAQNFWAQVQIDAEVRRLMSAKVMPNV